MTPKKIPTKPPPVVPPTSEPKLSVSFFGFKVDGSGPAGVKFAATIVLVFYGLLVLNAVLGLVAR